jgi:1,4-alpha-glucan branching enzyme
MAKPGNEDGMPRRPPTQPIIGPLQRHLFNEGRLFRAYEHLGAHLLGEGLTSFAVWAPNAESVSVIHDGNGWEAGADPLEPQASSGIWAGALSGAPVGTRYKYRVVGRDGRARDKADPLALAGECPPASASIVADLSYEWHDDAWTSERDERQGPRQPLAVYEVHLGSWRRKPDGSFYGYRELAPLLADHVEAHGFTHVELLPSWSTRTTDRGATRRPGSSPRRPATATRPISWLSSTTSTGAASE